MNFFGWLIFRPLLFCLGWFVGLMPGRFQAWVGVLLGRFLHLLKFRVLVVRGNLQKVFPGESVERVRLREKTEDRFFEHLGRLFLNFLCLFGPWKREVERFGTFEGIEHWKQADAKGKGVIFISSHLGNWEMMAAAGSLQGMDVLLVTKKLKPVWFHDAIEQGRAQAGVRCTYEPRTLKDVLRHLGKGGAVGFVIDQYAGPPVGIRVPFFGIPVGTQSAPAVLAKRTGAVVLPVSGYWKSPTEFVTRIEEPVQWIEDGDPNREIAINTEVFSRKVESWILAHPEQWLWTHRRFKGNLDPLPSDEWAQARVRH